MTTSSPKGFTFFMTLAVAIAVVAALSIFALQQYSASRFRLSNRIQAAGLDAQGLNGFAWVALADIDRVNFPNNPPEMQQSFPGDLDRLDALLKKTNAQLTSLPPDVKPVLADYVASIGRGRDLTAQRSPDAFPVMNSIAPKLNNVARTVAIAAERSGRQADRTYRYTSIASVMVLALAVIATAVLAWQYRRARQKVEFTESEQEIYRRSEARFRSLVQSSADVIGVAAEDGILSYVSPSVERMLGHKPENLVGSTGMELVREDDVAILEALTGDVRSRENYTASAEIRVLDSGGTEHCVEMFCTNRLKDPDVQGLVFNIRDVSERKALEEQLRHQAFHDSLTNLSNRALFNDRLEQALLRGKRQSHNSVSVLYMDLDHFKNVNDEMGHSAGDKLLQEVAVRLSDCIRVGDTAARLGGDEFAVLLEDGESAREARPIADRIIAEMSRPFDLAAHQVSLTASIGIVVADPLTMSAEEVVRNADLAMYDAKENGRDRAVLYEPGMHISLVERLRLVSELNSAIEKDELLVYYQPLLDLKTETVKGFEALVRWQHPSRGLLLPAVFIPLAEETGAILAIGEIVLMKACRQMKQWQETFGLHDLTMSVNISTKQIQRAGFVQVVNKALTESGLDPHVLTLEVTETALISQPQRAIDTLNGLKSLGLQIALDDFGTGYSSLSYLKRFPIDILKIDRMFIEGLEGGEKERLLAQSVIDLGQMLNLEIVAEGIERKDQLAQLKAMNCGTGQGYLFARPLPAQDAASLLSAMAPRNIEPGPSKAVA